MLLSCVMAFLINYCVFWNTVLNSALTQTICGNLKVCNSHFSSYFKLQICRLFTGIILCTCYGASLFCLQNVKPKFLPHHNLSSGRKIFCSAGHRILMHVVILYIDCLIKLQFYCNISYLGRHLVQSIFQYVTIYLLVLIGKSHIYKVVQV